MDEKKKSWFKRHPILTIGGLILVLFFINGIIFSSIGEQDVQEKNSNIYSTEDYTDEKVESSTSNSQNAQTLYKVTMGEKNALSKALSYLDVMAFSYTGLIKQLEYEGYSYEEAKYGVDNCGADWNKQAKLKAQSYLDMTAFSREGLIEQLEYEGFTKEQAEYGVQAVGY